MYAPTCPADALPADRAEMDGPGLHPYRAAWQIVIVHVEGRWQPALLTAWKRLPSGWVAHVRWRTTRNPGDGWAWLRHDPATIQPLTAAGLDAADLGA
ncbi:hypothetical protein [Kitasatospora viridis]|uniref:Uncharacterized protein n=1 Tax=Kitasatospora viridis TaxID=281105 RepID=A0A561UKK8_9ACTN|nr:hypothetical protein [Kitasatospora viridis]TWF99897.1 hypothetical protein FHX73_113757 [Kitasatospora viridis]